MSIKKEIELLLESLKKIGIERGEIEEAIGYSENYIDQTLSRGGNKKVLGAIKLYAQVLQKTIRRHKSNSMVNEDPESYTANPNYDKLINQILSDRQIIINLHEARSKQAEEMARKMESHYEDAKMEKARLLDFIDSSLKDITKNLKETAASLKQIKKL
jgi:hypothetical protein